jgi:hypothetical protein
MGTPETVRPVADAALYGTHTFLEPNPHVGLAISLRFNRR